MSGIRIINQSVETEHDHFLLRLQVKPGAFHTDRSQVKDS
jgi:hypothetical protein